MEIIKEPQAMQAWAKARRKEDKIIGLVPTMGFFHEGHLSLMRLAAQNADVVVVSLFVNPAQFGPNEDLATYPRDFERDMAMLQKEKVDAVFAPTTDLMYPKDFLTEVRVKKITEHLCGKSRPLFFGGIATVVTKLFNIVQPDVACFGEKDYQQLAMIRRMVADMNMPIRILGGPIVREADGLAMSSRNAYLDAESRPSALSLSEGLALARKMYAEGERNASTIIQAVERHILSRPQTVIDYVALIDGDSLEPVETADDRSRLALAVNVFGKVRLIDNGALAAAQ